jgi:N-acetylneuraminate lyase/4-hydroxy-tetrahydrodipicolinate synthase
MTRELYGIIPPLTTPFTTEGDVYEAGLRALVDFQAAGGSHGLFICGTYGSGPVMTLEERQHVHEIVVNQVAGRMTVVAHVGSTSTVQSVALAQHAEAVGADYVASVAPFYLHHDPSTIVEFFRDLVNAITIPVYAYNIPKTTGTEITPGLLRRLAEVGVRGVKDSGFGYIEFTNYVLEMTDDYPGFGLIIGTEGTALPAFMLGAQGCVSGLANVFPELVVDLWNAWVARDYDRALQVQMKILKARKLLHVAPSANAACYAILRARGIDAGMPKRPVLPAPEDKVAQMLDGFRNLGLL